MWLEALCPLPLTLSHLPPPPLQAGSAPIPPGPLPCLRGPVCPSPPFTRPSDRGMGLVLLPPQNHDSTWNSPSFPDSAAPHVQHPVGGLRVIDPCLPDHHCCSSSGLASGCVSVATSPSLCPHGHLLTSQHPSSISPTLSTRSLGNTCLIISFQPTLTCFEALKFSRLLFAHRLFSVWPQPTWQSHAHLPPPTPPHEHPCTHTCTHTCMCRLCPSVPSYV